MSNRLIMGLVVLCIGAAAGWYVLGSTQLPFFTKEPAITDVGGKQEAADEDSGVDSLRKDVELVNEEALFDEEAEEEKEIVQVSLTDNGFIPQTLTVFAGTTVEFVNNSSGLMMVASNMHPTHQLLPGFFQATSSGSGDKYSYSFEKVGTWTYHNDENLLQTGTVVVEE